MMECPFRWDSVSGESYEVIPSTDMTTWLGTRASVIATSATSQAEIILGPSENVMLYRTEMTL